MRHLLDARWRRLAISVVAMLAAAGGIAYAAIPGAGNIYTGCMLKNVGTVRLIDSTLPSSNLMSHCTALETQISWDQQGQKGEPGSPGLPGKNGADGVNGISPRVAQLPLHDSHCPAGGAAITDAAGATAYVCSGADGQSGKDGQPFAGSFASPNGLFSLTVADSGIELEGPNATLSLPRRQRRCQDQQHRTALPARKEPGHRGYRGPDDVDGPRLLPDGRPRRDPPLQTRPHGHG